MYGVVTNLILEHPKFGKLGAYWKGCDYDDGEYVFAGDEGRARYEALWAFKHTPYAAVPQLSANSGETIRRLCLEGNGIACLSDFTVAADIAAGHLHELLPDRVLNEAKPFYAVYYGDNAVSPKIRAFVDFLAERLGEKRAGAT